ncbi:MAG: VCBS repeat-containing protein [Bacteroidetes bacterium]|nr:VCBS repeat-containing protein [Bacteroidota bacterium]MBU1799919.1 VCBS repeat-containing protein [Bacteroidota bacterium]
MIKLKSSLILLILLLSTSLFAQDSFVRSAIIDPPSTYPSGFGATVSGVDLDGDGKLEIYSVDGMTDFMTGDEIPQIIKYERNGTAWDSVWAASFPNERQNSWAALTIGDLDNDGKQEIIWGFTNSFSVNTTPPRIVVFEANGDDVLGVSDGAGNFAPNAQWDLDLAASTNVRPLKWYAADIDGDGKQEVVFAGRQNTMTFGVISVSDIPDAGGATETWELKITNYTEFTNRFQRSNVIEGPDGGFGGVVTGMDYDADGLMDLYAINDNWSDTPNGELIPKLYKYEFVSGAWVLRWSSRIPGMDFQNTWPALTAGDMDKDGKGEIQWCPVNNFGAGNEDPDRIVVYETPGDGSDIMGVDNGDGTASPNAGWNMGLDSLTNMRPFRGHLTDIDGDSALEFVFTERTNTLVWGVIGVSDIPDNGDGSEVWTMKANGTPEAGNDYRDIAVIDQTIYLFGSGGTVKTITNDGTNYTVSAPHQVYPGWSWLSATSTDLNGDGNMEIVTGDYASGGSASVWVLVPDADSLVGYKIADFSGNTAKQITNVRVGDINADSLADFVVGFRGTDEIYRVAYNGGDITSDASYSISLLDKGVLGADGTGQMDNITLANIDGLYGDEVLYTGIPRSITANTAPLTVGKYSDILKLQTGAMWDITVANNSINIFDGSGNLQRVDYANDQWNIYPAQKAIVNGAFLTASTTDIENDGVEEIMVGNWYDAKVNMLKWINGAWVATVVADFTADGGNRLNGGAVGDIDGDGNIDFVTGSRESTPTGQIFRVEYTGGDVMDASSWKGEIIDVGMNPLFTQYEVINVANLDDDADLEVLYTTDYARGSNSAADAPFPIVILDLQKVQSETIAAVKVDSDGDLLADRTGEEVIIKGVVTTPDLNLSSSSSISFYVQDETGGINIYAKPKLDPALVPGDLVQITGTVAMYNGLTELAVLDAATTIVKLGAATIPSPKVITVAELMANGEKYESTLVKINALAKTASSLAWPAAGADANMTLTDGYLNFTMRVDKDFDLDGQAEPGYPISVTGFVSQYSTATPPNDGYQVMPRYYTDIEQNVPAPPSPYFFFTDETATMFDGQTVQVTATDQQFLFNWNHAVDLNGDALIYQLRMLVDGATKDYNVADSFAVLTGQQIITALSNTNKTVQFTLRTKGSESALVSSVDTMDVTFDIVVGVNEENMIPKEFFVDQNYPNPFNPSTTIKFGLPTEAQVSLIIYDILGREVARLVNNQVINAGIHHYSFDASQLSSGTYIYRLQADQKVEVKKMLLLK